jgi:SAM-dependent methyltransferase
MNQSKSPNESSLSAPSEWVTNFAPRIEAGALVLDLACGSGRHTAYFRSRGHPVTAIDRDLSRLDAFKNESRSNDPEVKAIEADLETDAGLPKFPDKFGGIIVTNYLHRPLFPAIIEALAPNGVLIYKTFAVGNEAYGKPRNSDHLLQPNELLNLCSKCLSVVAYKHGFVDRPRESVLQRICAINISTD